MSEKYAPGTVATATVRGVPSVRVMWTATNNGWVSERRITRDGQHTTDALSGLVWHPSFVVDDVRPLVVLDLKVSGHLTTENVIKALRNYDTNGTRAVAAQIEEQTRPPKPEEPTGLGAVVEDAKGRRWVGLGSHFANGQLRWQSVESLTFSGYASIDVAKVLSEGVQS